MNQQKIFDSQSILILVSLFIISLLPSYLCAAPPQLTDFSPADGATDVLPIPTPTLSWTGTDPDPGDTLTYDVYFGTSSLSLPLVSSNQTANSYQPSQVSHLTTYYWKVVARDNNSEFTEGTVLSFTTLNSPPQITSFSPADGATNVSLTPKLNWNAADPDPGDTLTYDIYFGASSPPSLVLSNQTNSYYYPGALNHFTTYYWKVIARDPHGTTAELPILSFTTLDRLPKLSSFSPADGSTGIGLTPTLSWVFTDADPDDTLTYDIYFGVTSPPPLRLSNQTITSYQPGQLAYSTRYYWKIVARDPHGGEGTTNEVYFDTISTDIVVDHSPSSVSRPQVCADGNGHAYAVWEDSRNGSSDIYFNYSSDYGATWQTADIRLDTNSPGISSSNYPQIACDSNGHVYVVWEDERNGSADIYFNYSSDYGKTWQSSDKKLSSASYAPPPQFPKIVCDNSGHVYVAWDDNYFNTSANFGVTWLSQTKRISTTGGIGTQLSCDQNGHVYLAWRTSDVFFNHSSDYGITWQTIDEIISNTNSIPYGLSLTNDGNGHVYCVWHDGRNSVDNPDVYFNTSPDYGSTWGASDVKLNMATPGTSYSIWPEVACDGSGHVYTVWYDRRNGLGDIYLNFSSDYGAGWQNSDKRLDTDSAGAADSGFPLIASDGRGHVYVIWADDQEDVGFGLYINSSLDNGANWQAQNIKVGTGGFYPQIVADSTRLYIVKDNNDILFNKLAPLLPTIPSPIDGATQVGVTPTLSWQGGDLNLDNLLTYDVYFGTASPPPLVSSNQTGTSYVPGTLAYLTTYYWQVVSKDSSGTETRGPIWSFTVMSAPPQFVLADFSPADGSTDVSLTAALSWNATDPDVGDTLVYDVYLSRDNPPPMLYKSNYSSNSINYEYDWSHYTVYYWQIVARDSHGTETRGPVLSFTTLDRPPVFNDTAYSPTNGATGVSLKPTLRWAATDPDYGDKLSFDIYFGTTSPPPLVASNQTTMSYQPGQLTHLTTYYWKIVVRDPHNAQVEGPILSFTTLNHVPKFSSTSPVAGAKGISLTPTLTWTATDADPDDTLVYDIYFGTVTPPPLVLSNQTVTSYQPGQLSNSTLYYWMIVARDPHGAETSILRTFTTISAPPQFDQSKFSPADGATGVTTKAVLFWSATDPDGDAITYDIYFGTTSPPPLVASNSTLAMYQPAATLPILTTYYWKIVARDSNGIETVGPILTFTTGDSPPVLQGFSPANLSTGVSAMTKLSWSATDPDPGDTITYDVYFDTLSPPQLVSSNQTGSTYTPATALSPLTTYYWKIVARDNHGVETVSQVLSFTTRENSSPVINSVSPNPCNPLQIVTITGLNFGDLQGSSTLQLGAQIFGAGSKKIIKWSDTRIDFKVPPFSTWPHGVTRTRKLIVNVNGVNSNIIYLKIYKP